MRTFNKVDAEIAEKLFGYRRMSFRRQNQSERLWLLTQDNDWFTEEGRKNVGWAPATPDEKPFADALRDVPNYSTQIEDAWLVVERITSSGLSINIVGADRTTASATICDLALKLHAQGLLT